MRNPLRLLLIAAACGAAATAGCAAANGGTADGYQNKANNMKVIMAASFNRTGDGPAFGANYEYRQRGKLGVGGFADVALAKRTSTVLGGAGFFHPADHWVAFAGPGVELRSGGQANALARIGGWYEFEVDEYTISPIGWIDLDADDVAFLVGVAFGFRF